MEINTILILHAGIFLVTNNQDALRGDLSTMCAELADKLVFSQT